jgi:hypothetical protein
MKLAEEVGPGHGPNALGVSQATASGKLPDAGQTGQATPAHVPPKNPGTHKPSETPHGPANALDDNASMKHPEQPVKVSSAPIAAIRKMASSNSGAPAAPPPPPPAGIKQASAKPAAAGVDPRLVDFFLATVKTAEDAINPAHITAGAAVPPDTSASGESGGAPAGGQPQGPTGLIGSNEAAINYTKREAKAHVKPELGKVLTEPALSAAHDSTLGKVLSHTSQAGVKISQAQPVSHSLRTLGARALLEKFAEEACPPEDKKKKSKESMGGMGTYQAPPVGGVAGAGA